MSLRLGVDLDGTLADLSGAYRFIERRLFNQVSERPPAGDDVPEDDAPADAPSRASEKGRSEAVWQAIRETTDFWLTLAPIDPTVVSRLWIEAQSRQWEVVFVTQRPATAGDTVQRQSQRWLMSQGFMMPSVVTLKGSRGRLASALELDILLDDTAKNCVDVLSDSRCRPILIQPNPDAIAQTQAARLRIDIAASVADALTLITAELPSPTPRVSQRLRRFFST